MMYRVLGDKDAMDYVVRETDTVRIIKRSWRPNTEFYFVVEYFIEPKYWIIPAVAYNGNTEGRGVFPRPTLSSGWFFREDRCSIPSAGIVEDDEYVVAVFTEPAKSEWELSSVSIQENKIIIRVPWTEKPVRYIAKNRFGAPKTKYLDEPLPYQRKFFVIAANYRKLGYERGYYLVIREAWRIFGRRTNIKNEELLRYIKAKAEYAINIHYFRLGRISSFLQFVFPNTPICGGSMSAGFTGKSMEAALALYRLYLQNGDKNLKDIAFSVANFHCMGLRKGFLLTDYQLGLGKWYGYSIRKIGLASTRQMGEALYSLLRLYKLARERGEANELWLRVSKIVGEKILQKQLNNGDFGKWVSSDRDVVVPGGTNGAYIIWFLLMLYDITENEKYLIASEKALEYYTKEYVTKDIYWGDTLDADCIDKEGGHAIMKAALMLYERTRERKFLDVAKRSAYFLSSWMFMWDVPFDPNSTLGKIKFRTFGWTAVSVENQHLDPYGLIIAPDLIRLYKYTKDNIWMDIGIAMASSVLKFGLKMISPEKWIFSGFQPEQLYHTDWTYSRVLQLLSAMTIPSSKDLKKILRSKGCMVNNVFWVASSCLNATLDLVEELSIEIPHVVVRREKGFYYKLFRLLRDLISIINCVI